MFNIIWNLLACVIQCITQFGSAWLIIEDLNEVVDSSKIFGSIASWNKCLFLQSLLQVTRGVDLEFTGGMFTWDNGREKVDRVIVDHQWMLLFPKATVDHLENSNHFAIQLRTKGADRKANRPFRFFRPGCHTI